MNLTQELATYFKGQSFGSNKNTINTVAEEKAKEFCLAYNINSSYVPEISIAIKNLFFL